LYDYKLEIITSVLGIALLFLDTLASGWFWGFSPQNNRITHMALHMCSSGAKSGRELFKGSKDVASLLVCTRKKFFGWGLRIFCE